MDFTLSKHAQIEIGRRGLSTTLIEADLAAPQQVVAAKDGLRCYQSRFSNDFFAPALQLSRRTQPFGALILKPSSSLTTSNQPNRARDEIFHATQLTPKPLDCGMAGFTHHQTRFTI